MGIHYGPTPIPFPSVVTFGNFDGVHLGHLDLLEVLRGVADLHSLHKVVVTFDPHPLCFLEGRKDFLIVDGSTKVSLLLPYSDSLYFLRFNERLKELSPRDFLNFLSSFINVRYIVSAENCRFGKLGAGGVGEIREYQETFSYKAVTILPKINNGERYSSTLVRSNIKCGNMSRVRQLLGRYHSIFGPVHKGRGLATKIGVPTINISIPSETVKPKLGVYTVDVLVKDIMYQGVANIGRRPTTCDSTEVILEVHLFNFSSDIYGESVRVYLKTFLREEKRFSSVEDLKKQILRDIQVALSGS